MTHLKEQMSAPPFVATLHNGASIALSDFADQKLALYFYPKDLTATCTIQACNLRDHYSTLLQSGINVIGISPDKPQTHQRFIDKHQLPFPLIADIDQQIAQLYGVWQLKKFMGRAYMGIVRTTFLINESSIIEKIVTKVESKKHAQQILSLTPTTRATK